MDDVSPAASLIEVEARLAHRFADPGLLATALTHRSWAHERGAEPNYERLEFLGDAVLALATAGWLYRRFPAGAEGELSRLKSYLVSEPVLAAAAERFALGDALRLGVGEERSGGRRKASLLADAFEAVVGALFLDAGFARAERFVAPLLEAALAGRADLAAEDPKSRLQEALQARGAAPPRYDHVAAEGPDHDRSFTVECWLGEVKAGVARGPSKKLAEQRAAAAALAFVERGESA
ncbi:MAG: ribonuclease III [Thermoanaerobaculia bacterium]